NVPPVQDANTESDSHSSTNNLTRTGAVRDFSVKGIRERRNESRVREPTTAVELNNNPWAEDMVRPSDLVLQPSGLQRRRTVTRSAAAKSGRQLQAVDAPGPVSNLA